VDIADGLNKNRILMPIELNDNSIDDDGCTTMAATLRENIVLTKIGHGIGPTGVITLAEMLRMNSSLRDHCVDGNKVP
jgi:hypothetical protein